MYRENRVLRQGSISQGFTDLFFMHKQAKLKQNHNLFIITSFMIRFFILSKELKLQLNHDERSRYNQTLQYYCFSDENNVQVDLTTFMARIDLFRTAK